MDAQGASRRILLTGAAGRIGTAFYNHARGMFQFRLADINSAPLYESAAEGDLVLTLDVSDLDACRDACRDIDTVIHLAASASPDSGFYESLLDNNIKGTWNIFQAAYEAGCKRVVFASSVHTVIGYPPRIQSSEKTPYWPVNMYGVSKCFGEATGSYYARTMGLSTICVRIGSYDAPWFHEKLTPENLAGYVSERDLNQMLELCITTPDIEFAIVAGLSNNRFLRMDLTQAREVLGYQPQDDAFELFQTDFSVPIKSWTD